MLRKIRIALAAIFFIGITMLLAGIVCSWNGWMAKLQFLPACLALNIGIIAGISILTFLFGRIYCSTVCPLGVLQDIIIWLRRMLGKRFRTNKHINKVFSLKHFSFSEEKKILRYSVLVLFIASLVAGIQTIVLLIAPYSAYGRIVGSIVRPHPWAVIIVAAVTFIGLAYLSWTYGRTWCNNVCPVGTVLSFIGRFSILRPVIDESKCNECGRCYRGCKSACIDGKNKIIDYSRCIDCFDCLKRCSHGAIRYKFAFNNNKRRSKQDAIDTGKRAFLGTALMFGAGAAVKAQEVKLDGGLAALENKEVPKRSGVLVPFGAKSPDNFYSHCTACQLCVNACPEKVLRPSSELSRIMQPEMGFEHGYCRPECTICSTICPTGAILKIRAEEKSNIHIGRASIDLDLCIVNREEVNCGNCSRHCPTGAILMVPKNDDGKLKLPSVIEDICIGCGACEYLCPSRPLSAIHVNGLNTHIYG